jgi:hypothetical protein
VAALVIDQQAQGELGAAVELVLHGLQLQEAFHDEATRLVVLSVKRSLTQQYVQFRVLLRARHRRVDHDLTRIEVSVGLYE